MGEYEFRSRSVTIQAVLFTGDNWLEMGRFCGATLPDVTTGAEYKMAGGDWLTRVHPVDPEEAPREGPCLRIDTWEGPMPLWPGEWLIRGTENELYPCKPQVFERKYERIAVIRQPEHVIIFAPETKPNMHHPEGCDIGACKFTRASMKIPLPMAEMYGSWTCGTSDNVREPSLVLKNKIA